MPDRPAPAWRIRWTELVMLMPMVLLMPFALVIALMAVKSGVACFTGDAMFCRYDAEPAAQLWYHLKGLGFGAGGVLAGTAVLVCALIDTPLLHRRALLSRGLSLALVLGLFIAVATVIASASTAGGWSAGWGRPVFVLSFTLLPAIVAVRHLPRVLRAAFPRHAESHVQ